MKLRPPLLTVTFAAIAVAVHLLPPAIAASLQFDRAALESGQWWRWLTAHFTHFGANHLGWDAAVFLVLGTVCEFRSRWRIAFALGLASLAISVAVYFWQPQFALYRGLSGLDCALFGMFAAGLLLRQDPISKIIGVIATIAAIAKCGFESETGSTAFASGAGYAPVPLAHLVGFLSGIATEYGASRVTRWSQSRQALVGHNFNPSPASRHPPSPSRRASSSTPRPSPASSL
jgi:rhomboid family GlyGly-CTERM serine protease